MLSIALPGTNILGTMRGFSDDNQMCNFQVKTPSYHHFMIRLPNQSRRSIPSFPSRLLPVPSTLLPVVPSVLETSPLPPLLRGFSTSSTLVPQINPSAPRESSRLPALLAHLDHYSILCRCCRYEIVFARARVEDWMGSAFPSSQPGYFGDSADPRQSECVSRWFG